MLKTCPMDENGFFNFGITNMWHRAIVSRAKVMIVEVTTGLPYVHGVENGVHVSEEWTTSSMATTAPHPSCHPQRRPTTTAPWQG